MIDNVIHAIKDYAKPLLKPSDLDTLIKEIHQESFVLLGESSHGTSEFYKMRAKLTKQLIKEKGFTYIAVEGDWPACLDVNRYIKGFDQYIYYSYECTSST